MNGSRRSHRLLSVTILVLLAMLVLAGPAAAAKSTPPTVGYAYNAIGYTSPDGGISYTAYANNVYVNWNSYSRPAYLVLTMQVCDATNTVCTTTGLTKMPVSPSTTFPVNLTSSTLTSTGSTCHLGWSVQLHSTGGKVLAAPIPVGPGGYSPCLKLP